MGDANTDLSEKLKKIEAQLSMSTPGSLPLRLDALASAASLRGNKPVTGEQAEGSVMVIWVAHGLLLHFGAMDRGSVS